MIIKKDADGNDIEPTAEELKAELVKVESDKENYKQGMLSSKEELKELKKKEVVPPKKDDDEEEEGDDLEKNKEGDAQEWDEASKKFQDETLTKTKAAAIEAVKETIGKENEEQAIADFREKNSEITDEEWVKVLANYDPKNGKGSINSIVKDLGRADVLRRFDAGEVIDPAAIAREDAQNNVTNLNTTTGAGNSARNENKEEGVSDNQMNIASKMKVSKEDLEKEDDSLSAEISIL